MTVKVTPKKKEGLLALGINDVSEVVNYYPYRYEVIEDIHPSLWKVGEKIVVEGRIISKPKMTYYRGKNSIVYTEIETDYNNYKISIFNRPWLSKLQVGETVTVFGKYEGSSKILVSNLNTTPLKEQIGIKPIYSLKDKLPEKYFIKLVNDVLEDEKDDIVDFIPYRYIKKYDYLDRFTAIKNIHQPKDTYSLTQGLKTLKYEEFLKFNIHMILRKNENQIQNEGFAKPFDESKVNSFIEKLPYKLTNDQLKSLKEILEDLRSPKQMYRILQGDVGSGKTVVALISMYAAYLAGKQAVLMAPTEILAKQHFRNMKALFEGTSVKCEVLYSSMDTKEKKRILQGLEEGSIDLICGTHSVFQDAVNYKSLGLVITDEQHRFGVKQRQQLLLKGSYPDVLMMSATPIPRTLATGLYGDLDVSTINETPNKGKVIHSTLIKQNSFIPKIDEIEDLLAKGNQMYVICPAIDEESTTGRNVNSIYQNLKMYFKNRYEVGLLHGQMTAEEKQEAQDNFLANKYQILVSTTVVEVGVDVKNANIMVIYDSNRFGLSQLHQLRGRVGRGEKEGYCYFLTGSSEEEAIKKLEFITSESDGFKISMYDLSLRGPGDILGYRQSGLPQFVLANIIDDSKILYESLDDTKEILNNLDDYPIIKEYVEEVKDKIKLLS